MREFKQRRRHGDLANVRSCVVSIFSTGVYPQSLNYFLANTPAVLPVIPSRNQYGIPPGIVPGIATRNPSGILPGIHPGNGIPFKVLPRVSSGEFLL